MSRTVGLVHLENMLEENASFPRGGGPTVGALQRRLQGDGRQRRQDPDSCRAEHKTAGQAGPDLLWWLARFLPGESKNRLPGDTGPHMQQHSHGHQRLWPAVLRARLPRGNVGVWGELLVSFPLVLRSSVQEMLRSERAQSLSLTILAGTCVGFCCSLATIREGFFLFCFCTFTTTDLFLTLHRSDRQCSQFSLLASSYG